MSTEKTIYITVVTPDGPVRLKGKSDDEKRSLLKYPAGNVMLPLFDGYMGVENLHAPTIAKLGFGLLHIQEKEAGLYIYVDGGVVQIKDNHISVLASTAKTAQQLDKSSLEKELAAMGPSNSLEKQIHKEKLQAQLQLLAKAS